MDVSISAEVTGPVKPDGKRWRHKVSHEWNDVDAPALQKLTELRDKIGSFIAKEHGKKEGQLTAVFQGTIDGVADARVPTVTVEGVTTAEVRKFQRFFYGKIAIEMIDFGDATDKHRKSGK